MQDRFGIDPAGGFDRAHMGKQRAEFVECAEMRRRAAQDADKGLLRILVPVERGKQHRALDLEIDAAACWPRQKRVELREPCFLREARRPAAFACCGIGQRGRALSRFHAAVRQFTAPAYTMAG